MSEVVTVQMPLELMRDIEKSLEQCAQDLAAEVSDRYPEAQREQYPTYARRWKNDMEPANRAEFLVQCIRSQPWWFTNHYKET